MEHILVSHMDVSKYYGLIEVKGPEAAAFLQGQIISDVYALSTGQSAISALCTAKGKVITTMRLLRGQEEFFLLLSRDLAHSVEHHLKTYVLRSKVAVKNRTTEYVFNGHFGEKIALPFPIERGIWDRTEEGFVFHYDDESRRYLTVKKRDIIYRPDFPLLSPCSENTEWWVLKDIESGYPSICADTSGEFLPQMLNLDTLGVISFQKGCYVGQEIIARTHYLGHVKRRMFRIRCKAPADFMRAGATIYKNGNENLSEAVGQVITTAFENKDSVLILAVLAVEEVQNGTLHFILTENRKIPLKITEVILHPS